MVILYMLVVMILTPVIYEWVNKRVTDRARNILTGLPSYTLNLALCVIEGLFVCLMPGGWKLTLTHWLMATALIYLGNQLVFNFFVKTISAARKKLKV